MKIIPSPLREVSLFDLIQLHFTSVPSQVVVFMYMTATDLYCLHD